MLNKRAGDWGEPKDVGGGKETLVAGLMSEHCIPETTLLQNFCKSQYISNSFRNIELM